MVARAPTAQAKRMRMPGSKRCAPSLVAWARTRSYDGAWRRSLMDAESITIRSRISEFNIQKGFKSSNIS